MKNHPVNKPSTIATFWPVFALLGAAAAVAYFVFVQPGGDSTEASDVVVSESTDDATGVDEVEAIDEPSTGGSESPSPATEIAEGVLPLTFQQAEAQGVAESTTFLGDCDPSTGRVMIPTVYAAPCVAEPTAADPAASSIEGDTIKIAVYQLEGELTQILYQEQNWPELANKFAEIFNAKYETWGRTVEFVPFQASGAGETEARADAQRVADSGAFASLSGPSQQPAYADELAARGVLCLLCGLGVPDSTFQEAAPYMWGPLQTPEQFLEVLADYVVNRVNNKPAVHAGDPAFQERTRTFGVVHFEQDPPVYTAVREYVIEQGEARGWKSEVFLTYQLIGGGDLGEQARSIIARLKADEITTVVFLGDPLFLGFLTQAATPQNYFPEWLITGTVFTDTTRWARSFDQQQWGNAFGISSFGVPVTTAGSQPYKLYEWFHKSAPPAPKDVGTVFDLVHQLYLGIHLAGPQLSPETFAAGLFNYPASGGTTTAPQISYGEGLFDAPDYLGYDDITEIWWDPEAVGPDENGLVQAGVYKYAKGGERYLPGSEISNESGAFDDAGSVGAYDAIPEAEAPPVYPAP